MDDRPTKKQMEFIESLCERLGYEPTLVLREAKTKRKASEIIDSLKKEL